MKVFSTASGECVRELKGHDGEVSSVTVNPQNKLQVIIIMVIIRTCKHDKVYISKVKAFKVQIGKDYMYKGKII